MGNVDNFKRHGSGTFYGILVAAGRTETAMASKRNKFKVTTRRASIRGTAKGRIPSVNHPVNVFNNRLTRV